MMKILFLKACIILFYILYVILDGTAYAEESKPCSVQVNSVNNDLLPVTYENGTRSNPDDSVYPGDAFHFLFEFSGSDTCVSFLLKPLVGSENMEFRSALFVSDGIPSPASHDIILYKWIPKYLKTFHYYDISGEAKKCIALGGDVKSCHTDYILPENLIFSYRQDQQLTKRQYDIIHPSPTCYFCKDLYKVVTSAWHLSQVIEPYNVVVDKHVLEDKISVDGFTDFVKERCDDLQKNQGCMFGHVEIKTEIDKSDQICLFEEMDKMEIEYDPDIETDQCMQKESQNNISLSVKGTGLRCNNNDDDCKTFTRTDDSSIAVSIVDSFGDIFFQYLQLYDPDGFPSKNVDGTYYLNNPIGIHGIPDASFKESRSGIISFNGTITLNPLSMMDFISCDKMCNHTLSGGKMSPSTHTIENGDMLSAHFSPDILGISEISHVSKMYNIGRYIGEYAGIAVPFVVVYDPQIIHTSTWSRLEDAGYQSFDNRYAIAIHYAGSLGGGPDDGSNFIIHPDRPVKITDVLGVYFMTNSFGETASDWKPDAALSDAAGLDDVTIHKSIYGYIPANYTFVDSFPNSATVHWNGTIQDTMIDSAGYARILRDVDISEEQLETFYINVTSHDTLVSQDYGGVSYDFLASSEYAFPWGYFSTPLNVTAYYSTNNGTSFQDTDVVINHIDLSDAQNNSEFVSAVEFYLNKHDSPELAFMHMADLYDMNPKIDFDDGDDDTSTVLILLNKTGIHYDVAAYNKAIKNGLLGEFFVEFDRHDILDLSSREFFIEPSYYSVEMSASRDYITKTNVIHMGGAELSNVIKYKINMHPENYLAVNKFDDTAIVAPNSYFGEITELFVNSKPYTDMTCSDGCLVFLPDSSATDISITNMWGGIATAKNVTGHVVPKYNTESWIDVAPMRLFWFGLGLAVLYFGYRGIKLLYKSRK